MQYHFSGIWNQRSLSHRVHRRNRQSLSHSSRKLAARGVSPNMRKNPFYSGLDMDLDSTRCQQSRSKDLEHLQAATKSQMDAVEPIVRLANSAFCSYCSKQRTDF